MASETGKDGVRGVGVTPFSKQVTAELQGSNASHLCDLEHRTHYRGPNNTCAGVL